MRASPIKVYVFLYSTPEGTTQDAQWGEPLQSHFQKLCPPDWVYCLAYPQVGNGINHAYIEFSYRTENRNSKDCLRGLCEHIVTAQLPTQFSEKAFCKPVNPGEEYDPFITIHSRQADDAYYRDIQFKFCQVLLESILNETRVPKFQPGSSFNTKWLCGKSANLSLNRLDCEMVTAECSSLILPRTVNSARPDIHDHLFDHSVSTSRDIATLEKELSILKGGQTEEGWLEDARQIKVKKALEFLPAVWENFAAARLNLDTAIQEQDWEGILEYATHSLEQSGLLYRLSLDEEERRLGKALPLAAGGGITALSGFLATRYLSLVPFIPVVGTVAMVGGTIVCIGALYLYWKSDYLKKQAAMAISSLLKIWTVAQIFQSSKTASNCDILFDDFSRKMKETFAIDVQDWSNSDYVAEFLQLESKSLDSKVVKIREYMNWRKSWTGRFT